MIVTIGQPGLFPWWGTFAKIAASDVVVHLDHVSWQKGGYLNRFRTRVGEHGRWSTIPLSGAHLGTPISQMQSAMPSSVLQSHLERISQLEEREHSADAAGLIERTNLAATADVCATAIDSTEAVSGYLGLSTRSVRSTALSPSGSSTSMLLGLLKNLGATAYLFGGGRSGLTNHYLDIGQLTRNGVAVGVARYSDAPRTSVLQRIAASGGGALQGTSMEIEWL